MLVTIEIRFGGWLAQARRFDLSACGEDERSGGEPSGFTFRALPAERMIIPSGPYPLKNNE
jgi:hypothetical protein